jgi:hypothetical protein
MVRHSHQLLNSQEGVPSTHRIKSWVRYRTIWILGRREKLIKMCVNETCSRVRVGKHLSDRFSLKNGLKHRYASSPLLQNMPLAVFRQTRRA